MKKLANQRLQVQTMSLARASKKKRKRRRILRRRK